MGAIRRVSLASPDVKREADNFELSVSKLGAHTIGYSVLQPGFRWSTHRSRSSP